MHTNLNKVLHEDFINMKQNDHKNHRKKFQLILLMFKMIYRHLEITDNSLCALLYAMCMFLKSYLKYQNINYNKEPMISETPNPGLWKKDSKEEVGLKKH